MPVKAYKMLYAGGRAVNLSTGCYGPAAPDTAESGVKRNIPGPCGKAPAVNGDSGWRDVRRDASGAGGTGAAGRAQSRGAGPAGDRAAARRGGLDVQPRAAAQRPAEGRLPAGARRGLLPGAPAAAGGRRGGGGAGARGGGGRG